MAYASLTELKQILFAGEQEKPVADDGLLNSCLTRAQAFIESPEGANRVFEASSDTTRYFDAVRNVKGRVLLLDYPCLSITTLTNGDGQTISSTNYVTEPVNYTPFFRVRLKATSTYSWVYIDSPENAISIAGKWAWSLTAPADIKQTTLRLATWLYRQKDTGSDSDRTIVTPGGIIMPSALPKDVMSVCMAYRSKT